MLSVGKSNALVQILPAAVRFWTKRGLRPRGGSKDVTAFIFFEDAGEAREEQVAGWLESTSQAYEVRHIDICDGTDTDTRPGQEFWETFTWLCGGLYQRWSDSCTIRSFQEDS